MGWKKNPSHVAYRCYLKVLLWGPGKYRTGATEEWLRGELLGAGTLLRHMRIAKGKRDRRERDRASRQASHGEHGERTDVRCGTKERAGERKSTQKSGGQKKWESWEYWQITTSHNSRGNFQPK